MIIASKDIGPKIHYAENGTEITFAEELTLDIAELQEEWDVHRNIFLHKLGHLTTGKGGVAYVAELDIPACTYSDPEEEDGEAVRNPPDMESVMLTLWPVSEELAAIGAEPEDNEENAGDASDETPEETAGESEEE